MKRKNLANPEIKDVVTRAQKAGENTITISNDTLTKNILADLEAGYKLFESLLKSTSENRVTKPLHYTFADFVKDRWGFAKSDNGQPDSFYHQLGIDPSIHTIDSLFQGFPNEPDTRKWLAPAVIREAIREGIYASNLYSELIRGNVGVGNMVVTMPKILAPEANVKATGEGESIVVGTAKFGQKDIRLRKFAYGIEVSYEVLAFVPLNIVNTYLEDAGAKFATGLTTLAMQVLINGDQSTGSESAAVIGVDNTTNGVQYRDILRAWVRMQLLGRRPTGLITNETQALSVLNLDEFKKFVVGAPEVRLNLKTPIPETQNHWVHSSVPNGRVLVVDTNNALVQLTAMDLMVESERIVNKQLSGTYASMITGFANLQRNARVIIDGTQTFTALPFPAWMAVQDVVNL